MKERRKQEFKIDYKCVPDAIQLEQGFRILAENFYKTQKAIKEKLKENENQKSEKT